MSFFAARPAGKTGLTAPCTLTDDPLRCGASVTTLAAGSTITVYDAGGSALFSGTVEKGFNPVVISSPLLTVGETYTVSSGSSSGTKSSTARN